MRLFNNLANLPVILFVCSVFISGLQSRHVNVEDDLTVLIDFAKYQQLASSRRHPRDAAKMNQTKLLEVCGDLKTEEYKKCGNKCVLGCKYDPSSTELTISNDKCDKDQCVEGCFCKDGFVRHQDKCIPPIECPVRAKKSIDFMNQNNPTPFWRHLGLFNRPMGCGANGCGPPIHIHNHNKASSEECDDCYSDSDSDESSDESYRQPVIVHVHGGGSGGGANNYNNNNNNIPGTNIIQIPSGCQGNCGPNFSPPNLPPFIPAFPGGGNNGIGGGNNGGLGLGAPQLNFDPTTGGFTLTFPNGMIFSFTRNGTFLGMDSNGIFNPGLLGPGGLGGLLGGNGGLLGSGGLLGTGLTGVGGYRFDTRYPYTPFKPDTGVFSPYDEIDWSEPNRKIMSEKPQQYDIAFQSEMQNDKNQKKKPSKKGDVSVPHNIKQKVEMPQYHGYPFDMNNLQNNRYQLAQPPNGFPPYPVLGAAISPAFIPIAYYPVPHSNLHSDSSETKKKTGGHDRPYSESNSKESMRTFTQHGAPSYVSRPNNAARKSSSSNKKHATKAQSTVKSSNPVYTASQTVAIPANQAMYYDYLNSFTPNPSIQTN